MKIKPGTLIKLGNHRLICGDSSNPEIIKKLVGNDTIQAIITDPPYGVGYVENKLDFSTKGKKHKKIANDQKRTEAENQVFCESWLSAVSPHLARPNSLYIFTSDTTLFALYKACQRENIHFGQLLVWVKNTSVLGRLDYQAQHELIVYGWLGTHSFAKAKDKSVLFCPKTRKNTLHPTMKPISLLRRLILNSTKLGDTVFDGFGGSGSTLIACEQTKRRCLMVEIDPEYCLVICERFTKLTGIKAELVEVSDDQ